MNQEKAPHTKSFPLLLLIYRNPEPVTRSDRRLISSSNVRRIANRHPGGRPIPDPSDTAGRITGQTGDSGPEVLFWEVCR